MMWKKGLLLVGGWLCALSAWAVDVNKATAQELVEIKGIGQATAQRIVEERAKEPFKDWGDFIHRVKGVGQAKAQQLSEAGLTVGEAAYAPAAATATPAAAKEAQAPAQTAPAPKADAAKAEKQPSTK
ncbi:ComEA family DNA-binding protein [Allofranklinella schreckenbergeri]|nr:helix-hairpin-helix domain-containing protein [Allofranklinella schreckenbergeri]